MGRHVLEAWEADYMTEVAWRPVEHILEMLSCRDLATILDVTRMDAWDMKSDRRALTPSEEGRLRAWCRQTFPGKSEET